MGKEVRLRRKLMRVSREETEPLLVNAHERLIQVGPNGRHVVGVYEAMGPSVKRLLDDRPKYRIPDHPVIRRRLPPAVAKQVLFSTGRDPT